MALGSNPSHVMIASEFAPNSAPSSSSMSSLHNEIYGSVSGTHSAFANGGRPAISNVGVASGNTSITVSYTIDVRGTYGRVEIYYQPSQSGSIPSSWSGASSVLSSVYNSNTSDSITISGLSQDQTYALSIYYFNDYNDDLADRDPDDGYNVTRLFRWSTTGSDQLSTPAISTCSSEAPRLVNATWNYSENADLFIAEIRFDNTGGTNFTDWISNNELMSSSNWGTTTDPKEAQWDTNTNELFNPGARVQIRIQAVDTTGGFTASQFSAECESFV